MAEQDIHLIVCVLSVGQQLYYPACQHCFVRLRTQNNRLKLNVTDQDSIADVTLFGKCVENVIGRTATELHRMLSTRQSRYDKSLANILQYIINYYFIGSMIELSFSSHRYNGKVKCQHLSDIKVKQTRVSNFYTGCYPSFIATKIEPVSTRKCTVIEEFENALSQMQCACSKTSTDIDHVEGGNFDGPSGETFNNSDWQVLLWDSEEWKLDEIETNDIPSEGLSEAKELLNTNFSTTAKESDTFKLNNHQWNTSNTAEYSYNKTWVSASPPSLNLTCCSCGHDVTVVSNLERSWLQNNVSISPGMDNQSMSWFSDYGFNHKDCNISVRVKDKNDKEEVIPGVNLSNHNGETQTNFVEQNVTFSSSNDSIRPVSHPVTCSSPRQTNDESLPSETLLLYSRCNSSDSIKDDHTGSSDSGCNQNYIFCRSDTRDTLLLFSPINTAEIVNDSNQQTGRKRRRTSHVNLSRRKELYKENVVAKSSAWDSNINVDQKKLSLVFTPSEKLDANDYDSETLFLFSQNNTSASSQHFQDITTTANQDQGPVSRTNKRYSCNDQNAGYVGITPSSTLKRKLFKAENA
ncbi:uncharacterized protein TRIADDRAFT_56577 [Trichoplax adhaerens]|uniref:Replication factor A C-terminal domain-containing protein n=1 Tax=Trichoplax adhaerens TaxID=10228 RepID=B3RYJ2_TRIAD|nr:hypothetical protein TRIADDRAFT_56577 [Trichoplax adhaerens]EDV24607.1 hypothetical protein TRIADDRAFT_56577 [Trichoplax adhaerens]|eukprot:XP_002112497.1 hypothetical protein TRIADDRAFT_56577 [Trichoplax adhaerens]